MHQFTTNDFTKVGAVLNDIDKFKKNILELNRAYEEFLNRYPMTLDYKINVEFAYKKIVNDLFKINKKQKQITSALGKGFVKSAKEIVNDEEYRNFIETHKF